MPAHGPSRFCGYGLRNAVAGITRNETRTVLPDCGPAIRCPYSDFALSGRGWTRRAFVLIADVDPLAQIRVPLRAGSGAAGATQAADSYEYSTTSAASSAAAAATNGTATGATATSGTATDSATAASGAATDSATAAGGAADTGMSATAADTGMGASAAAAAMSAAAAAATAAACNSYALAKRGIFPVEDLKGRQTDVRDFLLGQKKSPCVVLRRYIRRGRAC